MQDRIARLEARLADIEQRLSALEGGSATETVPGQPPPEPALGEGFVENASTHIGRTLLIFGGAYLLRAITEFEFVPTGLGILMGASYALFWLYMAYRQAHAEVRRTSAAIFGGISVVLAMPLLVEATDRFQLLSGSQSVLALTVYCALGLTVAARSGLRSLGWLVTAGGVVTAIALVIVSRSAISAVTFLVLLGFGSLWVVYWRQWMGLQWLGAIGAIAGVVALALLSRSDKWSIEPGVAAIFGTVVLLLYLLSFSYRSHVQGHDTGLFEALQAPAAAGTAFWTASIAAGTGQFSLLPIGMLSIVLGAASYALAFSPETRRARGRNFYFFSTLGLFFAVAGSGVILPPTAAALLWSLMAIAMAWLSGRTGRVSLSLQCTLLLIAAAGYSGILNTGLQAFVGDATTAWPTLIPPHVGVAITTVICLFLPVAQHSERWGAFAGLPQLVVLALSVWEVGGLIVLFLAPIVANVTVAEPDLAVLAALRTAVLSVSSVTLALSSRYPRWPEARWLAYPVLVMVGFKLFVEDFPNGQPATLFVALAFVGGGLLLVAKLIHHGQKPNPT